MVVLITYVLIAVAVQKAASIFSDQGTFDELFKHTFSLKLNVPFLPEINIIFSPWPYYLLVSFWPLGVNCKKSVKQNNVQKKSGAEEHSPCRNTKNKQSKKNGGTAHPPTKRKKKSPATSSKKNKQPWELTTKERYNSLIRGEHCQISSEFGISTKLLYGISWQGLEESCFDQSIDVDFGECI